MEYNEENLRLLYGQELSMSQIARQLGVTRNKVSGKCNRMGLNGRKTGGKPGVCNPHPARVRKLVPYAGFDPEAKPFPKPRKVPGLDTTIGTPRVEMTKSQMYDMLRKAVENT